MSAHDGTEALLSVGVAYKRLGGGPRAGPRAEAGRQDRTVSTVAQPTVQARFWLLSLPAVQFSPGCSHAAAAEKFPPWGELFQYGQYRGTKGWDEFYIATSTGVGYLRGCSWAGIGKCRFGMVFTVILFGVSAATGSRRRRHGHEAA